MNAAHDVTGYDVGDRVRNVHATNLRGVVIGYDAFPTGRRVRVRWDAAPNGSFEVANMRPDGLEPDAVQLGQVHLRRTVDGVRVTVVGNLTLNEADLTADQARALGAVLIELGDRLAGVDL